MFAFLIIIVGAIQIAAGAFVGLAVFAGIGGLGGIQEVFAAVTWTGGWLDVAAGASSS